LGPVGAEDGEEQEKENDATFLPLFPLVTAHLDTQQYQMHLNTTCEDYQ
jgi:hypothetical protein